MGLDPGRYYFDIRGKEKLLQQLQQRSLKGRKTLAVQAGYRAHYAVFVHEDPWAFHPIGKWRYLADPLRRGRGQMGKIMKAVLLQKRSLEAATWAALEWLREASGEEVPVSTGFLKNSWFVRLA